MSKDRAVSRPLKKAEFEIRFATREAEKGWVDARATARNALVDAWDFLTRSPQERCDRCYPLRGDLNKVTIGGKRSNDGSTRSPTVGASGTRSHATHPAAGPCTSYSSHSATRARRTVARTIGEFLSGPRPAHQQLQERSQRPERRRRRPCRPFLGDTRSHAKPLVAQIITDNVPTDIIVSHPIRKRRRYSLGVVSSWRRKARASVSMVLKPQVAAIRWSVSSLVSSRCRATSTRADSI